MWHLGLTFEEDRQLEEDYAAHEKECAENVMLVGLGSSEQNFCGLGQGMRRLYSHDMVLIGRFTSRQRSTMLPMLDYQRR